MAYLGKMLNSELPRGMTASILYEAALTRRCDVKTPEKSVVSETTTKTVTSLRRARQGALTDAEVEGQCDLES